MSISNQVKFLKLEVKFSLRFERCYFIGNSNVSEIFPIDYCCSFSYQKQKDKILVEKNFDYYCVEDIFNILKDYHLMSESQFILTYGKDPFSLNYFNQYIEMVLHHPKISS